MFARDTKNNMHTQQYYKCAGSDRKITLPFLGCSFRVFGCSFRVLYFFLSSTFLPPCLKSSSLPFSSSSKRESLWVDETATKRGANLSSKRRALEAHPYRPNAPGLGPRALLFFFCWIATSLVGEKEREKEEHTRRRGGFDLSRWRKKTPLLDGRVCERVLSNSLPSL